MIHLFLKSDSSSLLTEVLLINHLLLLSSLPRPAIIPPLLLQDEEFRVFRYIGRNRSLQPLALVTLPLPREREGEGEILLFVGDNCLHFLVVSLRDLYREEERKEEEEESNRASSFFLRSSYLTPPSKGGKSWEFARNYFFH